MNDPDTGFFVVLGHARTGTNLFCSLLNSNPAVTCAFEVLHPGDDELRKHFHTEIVEPTKEWLKFSPGKEKKKTVHYIESKLLPKATKSRPFGPKLLYPHIQELGLFSYLARHNFSFLHVTRNPIEVYVSLEQARQTGQWYAGRGEPRPPVAPAVDINPAELGRFISSYKQQVDRHNRISPKMFKVDYANLCADPQGVMDRAFGFLGVASGTVKSQSRKQQSWNIADRISNFDWLLTQVPEDVRDRLLALTEREQLDNS